MIINTLESGGMYLAGVLAGSAVVNLMDINFEPRTIAYGAIGSALTWGLGFILNKWKCTPLEDDTALMELANEAVQRAKNPRNLPRALYTAAGMLASPAWIALVQAGRNVI